MPEHRVTIRQPDREVVNADVVFEVYADDEKLGELDQQAIPYLEETLNGTESAEVRLRVKRILEEQQRAPITSEQLRQIRAVMVLERIGDGYGIDLVGSQEIPEVGLTHSAGANQAHANPVIGAQDALRQRPG